MMPDANVDWEFYEWKYDGARRLQLGRAKIIIPWFPSLIRTP
jgi:hypothetical protein